MANNVRPHSGGTTAVLRAVGPPSERKIADGDTSVLESARVGFNYESPLDSGRTFSRKPQGELDGECSRRDLAGRP